MWQNIYAQLTQEILKIKQAMQSWETMRIIQMSNSKWLNCSIGMFMLICWISFVIFIRFNEKLSEEENIYDEQISPIQEQDKNDEFQILEQLLNRMNQSNQYREKFMLFLEKSGFSVSQQINSDEEKTQKELPSWKQKYQQISKQKQELVNKHKEQQLQSTRKLTQVQQQKIKVTKQNWRLTGSLSAKQKQLTELAQKMQEKQLKWSEMGNVGNLYDKLFQGDILQDIPDKKKQLLEMLEASTKKKIRKTKHLYKLDLLNTANVHRYIDGHPNLLLIIQMQNGNLLGGFSLGQLLQGQHSTQFGILFSLTNNKYFHLSEGAKSLVHENQHIVFGNSELRIKIQNTEIYSNFGHRMNQFFESNGENVNTLLGMGNNIKTGKMKSYQIYQIIFDM